MSLSDVHGYISWVMLKFHRIRFNCYIIRVVALHCQSFTLHVDDVIMLNWEQICSTDLVHLNVACAYRVYVNSL
jgi:hypothetical protein